MIFQFAHSERKRSELPTKKTATGNSSSIYGKNGSNITRMNPTKIGECLCPPQKMIHRGRPALTNVEQNSQKNHDCMPKTPKKQHQSQTMVSKSHDFGKNSGAPIPFGPSWASQHTGAVELLVQELVPPSSGLTQFWCELKGLVSTPHEFLVGG